MWYECVRRLHPPEHIIILDGHHSHKTLTAVNYARQHGIHLLTLPPHCNHKMQPLDRTYFKSLKTAYNASADSWMVGNPGKRISFFDMAGIFGKAYLRSATPEKAVHGFAVCGLWPYDENIFSESDFTAAAVTDEAEPTDHLPSPEARHTDLNPTTNDVPSSSTTVRICVGATPAVGATSSAVRDTPAVFPTDGSLSSANADHQTHTTIPVTGPTAELSSVNPASVLNQSGSAVQDLIRSLSPLPKKTTPRSRKRKTEGATLLTSSPFKNMLQEKEALKASKGRAKGQKTKAAGCQRSSIKGKSRLAGKGKGNANSSTKSGAIREGNNCNTDSSDDDEWPCLICGEPYSNSKSKEVWVQCMSCDRWAHEACTTGERLFVCPNCDSELDSDDSDD